MSAGLSLTSGRVRGSRRPTAGQLDPIPVPCDLDRGCLTAVDTVDLLVVAANHRTLLYERRVVHAATPSLSLAAYSNTEECQCP